jgi:exopolyphosphatase/guanosine-5'-triphosphate,3'-diphosphate pyrophosphatase
VTTFHHAGREHVIPVGPTTLLDHGLTGPDPPAPAQLTNALGVVSDHLDDVIREVPGITTARDVRVLGDEPWHLARVERGGDLPESTVPLAREAAEEVFRALATERRADRLQNPGLDPRRVDTILGTCCLVLTVMRRLRLDRVLVGATAGTAG